MCKNNAGLLSHFPCTPQLPCGSPHPSPWEHLHLWEEEKSMSVLPHSIPSSLASCLFHPLFSGADAPKQLQGTGLVLGRSGFCVEERKFEEGSPAEFSPQNGVVWKNKRKAVRLGRSCCRHCAGPEHLEVVCGWIPDEPDFPEGSLSARWLEHLPGLHWYTANPSSWINLVLFVAQLGSPSCAILFLSVARALLHRARLSALESSSGNGPDLPAPLLPPSLCSSGSVLCLEVSGRCSNK